MWAFSIRCTCERVLVWRYGMGLWLHNMAPGICSVFSFLSSRCSFQSVESGDDVVEGGEAFVLF